MRRHEGTHCWVVIMSWRLLFDVRILSPWQQAGLLLLLGFTQARKQHSGETKANALVFVLINWGCRCHQIRLPVQMIVWENQFCHLHDFECVHTNKYSEPVRSWVNIDTCFPCIKKYTFIIYYLFYNAFDVYPAHFLQILKCKNAHFLYYY